MTKKTHLNASRILSNFRIFKKIYQAHYFKFTLTMGPFNNVNCNERRNSIKIKQIRDLKFLPLEIKGDGNVYLECLRFPYMTFDISKCPN